LRFSTEIRSPENSHWDSEQLAQWASQRLKSIFEAYNNNKLSNEKCVGQLYALLEKVAYLATTAEGLEFPTLFSRLAYLKSLYNIHGRVLFGAQTFRKQVEQKRSDWTEKQLINIGFWVNDRLISTLWDAELQLEELDTLVNPLLQRDRKILTYEEVIRGVLLGEAEGENVLQVLREDDPEEIKVVHYNEADRNDIFTKNMDDLIRQGDFPVQVHLWHVEVDQRGQYHPKAMIIEPDFLIDVTAIAACFDQKPVDLLPYMLRKFTPTYTAPPLLKGNVANYILDQLLQNEEIDFKTIFKNTFHLFPLDYACLTNEEMKNVYEDAKAFYLSIQKVVKERFPQLNITSDNCAIEPSFYQPDLGLQGRLDVLHFGNEDEPFHIIELKSGKTFMPNKYGLNSGHYVQTLLYDLLVNYALPGSRVLSYILYCKEYDHPLRNAPIAQEQQIEALQIRNRIILWERYLNKMKGRPEDVRFFKKLNPQYFNVYGFVRRDLEEFQKVFKQLHPVEQQYFAAFIGFLSREYHLSKVGVHQSERNYGLAAIWRQSSKQKADRFALLNALKLKESHVEEDHTLFLERTEATDPLANFRAGDIAILYPESQQYEPARGEVFKCSIVEISEDGILLRLRNIQVHGDKFTKGSKWCLEHDVFDSSFNQAFQNLYLWASSPAHKRAVFMGIKPPSENKIQELDWPNRLTSEQKEILSKMSSAKDYFLLWGPPGTGKTSIMLKHYVQRIIKEKKDRVMLLAYTNRAVDEICATLESIREGHPFDYIRVGSRYSTGPDYRSNLLQLKSKSVDSRKELRSLLDSHQIYVGTVASFSGKKSLLNLLEFDQAIIDEASQLLEPMMGNIIHHFPKIIMIGDHLQLPAVVQQSANQARVEEPNLKKIGLDSLGNSLFERLYHRAMESGWHWAYDALSVQGRMHNDIAVFPSTHFYNNGLETLSHIEEFKDRLFGKTEIEEWPDDHLEEIGRERLCYVPSQIQEEEKLGKTNLDEAKKTVRLIQSYHALWKANNWDWTEQTVGVITPFRAQIAQIRKQLWALGEEWTKKITVDTVERYQGGARDIIIMSLCANHPAQWDAIISKNEEGIDRKLNVALTRARYYFTLIANPEMVEMQALYSKLREMCVELDL
jgi:DNA replication ATP-dependent helicase Dna2